MDTMFKELRNFVNEYSETIKEVVQLRGVVKRLRGQNASLVDLVDTLANALEIAENTTSVFRDEEYHVIDSALAAARAVVNTDMKPTWWRILLIDTLCEWGYHRWGDWREYSGPNADEVRYCKVCNRAQLRDVKP